MSAAVDSKTSQLSRAEEAVRSGRQQLQRLELRLGQLRSQKAQAQVTKVRGGGGWCRGAAAGG
jgi:phage shock protein A